MRDVLIQIHELAVHPHPIYLLQAQGVVPEIRLSQTPPVSLGEVLQLPPDFRHPVEDRFQRVRDALRLILSLDFLCDVKAFFEEGGADSLGGGDGAVRAKKFPIDSLAVHGNRDVEEG